MANFGTKLNEDLIDKIVLTNTFGIFVSRDEYERVCEEQGEEPDNVNGFMDNNDFVAMTCCKMRQDDGTYAEGYVFWM